MPPERPRIGPDRESHWRSFVRSTFLPASLWVERPDGLLVDERALAGIGDGGDSRDRG